MKDIAFIGAGNVCWHFVKRFLAQGFSCHIYGRNEAKIKSKFAGLEGKVHIHILDEKSQFKAYQMVFLSVGDGQIESVAKNHLSAYDGIVVHNSGATALQALSQFGKYAVVYPFQTFNAGVDLSATDFPVFVEANDAKVEKEVLDFLKGVFAHVSALDSESRKKLHIAGVMANNFVNALLNAANQLVDEINLPKSTMRPLVQETMNKYFTDGAAWAYQTGPAKRRDYTTIGDHVNMLRVEQPALEEIYSTLTRFIINHTSAPDEL